MRNVEKRLYRHCATSAQCCFNAGHECCINVIQHWKSGVGFCFIFNVGSKLFQGWSRTLNQRWSTTLNQCWSDVEMLAGLNIIISFIPTEIKIFNDWEPLWLNNSVKTMIRKKIQNLATKLLTSAKVIYRALESCKIKFYKNIWKLLRSELVTPEYY